MTSTVFARKSTLVTILKSISFLLLVSELAACGIQESPNNLTLSSPLDGTWRSECTNLNENESSRVEFTFKNGQFNGSATAFSGTNCDSEKSLFVGREQARYAVSGATKTPLSATKIDYSEQRMWMKPVNQEVSNSLITNHAFGLSNWSLNQELEVTGKDDPNAQVYSIFHVTGNRLCLGKESAKNNGQTEVTRFNELKQGAECLTRVTPNG